MCSGFQGGAQVRVVNGGVVGHVALDLKSRDGKFGHQMVVPLRPALDGATPACCVLGNLGDERRRLRFREVETLLHELGHVMHQLCSRSRICRSKGHSSIGRNEEARSRLSSSNHALLSS